MLVESTPKNHPGPSTLHRHHTLLLYAIIGMSGVLLDLVLFLVLYNLAHLDKNLATFLSTTAGITNNFFWNAHFNFRVHTQLLRRYAKFYAVGLLGILLTLAIFRVFVDQLGFNANIVKIGSLFPVLIFQYSLNKLWTFNKADQHE